MLKRNAWPVLCAILCISQSASAHLRLTDPPPRHPEEDLKYGPCGLGEGDTRSTDPAKISTFAPGQVITVVFTETVDHDPSHYRISFSQFGDTEFEDPLGFDDFSSEYPVLLDNIPDANDGAGHEFSVQVTLPNVTCDTCTLQVIQVMHDKPPWGPEGGDDIYYQCADLILAGAVTDPPLGSGGTPSDPPTGAGGASMMTPGSGGDASMPVDPSPGEGDGGTESSEEEASRSCAYQPRSDSGLGWSLLLSGLVAAAGARRSKHRAWSAPGSR